jgi:thiol:disulfide interchange protein
MNDRRNIRLAACGLAALALAASGWWGCSRATSNSATAAATAIELTPVDRAGLDALIERHRGQVVLVDYWATWCLPCLEQLPHSIELAAKERDRGLAVVTLSLGGPTDTEPARTVLTRLGAGGVTNLISELGGGPQAAEAFEITGGAIPHYKLFDRTGQLRRTFAQDPAASEQFTPADIDAAVAVLLAE